MQIAKKIWVWAAVGATFAVAPASAATPTGQQLLSDWMDIIRSGSRVLIYVTSALGIIFAARSLYLAYEAPSGGSDTNEQARHLFAALFAGVITITGVVIGWVSGLLVPT